MDGFVEAFRRFWMDLQQGQVAPLGIWSYVLLMVLIIIQGPVCTMFGGAAAAAGLLNPLGVLFVAALGNLSADITWYTIGARSQSVWRWPVLNRFLRRHRAVVEGLEQEMREQAVKILLLAKLSVGMAVPAILAAGVARVSWRRWFPVVFAGELLWSGSLLMVGYYAAGYILAAESVIVRAGALVSVLLLLVLSFAILREVQQVKECEKRG